MNRRPTWLDWIERIALTPIPLPNWLVRLAQAARTHRWTIAWWFYLSLIVVELLLVGSSWRLLVWLVAAMPGLSWQHLLELLPLPVMLTVWLLVFVWQLRIAGRKRRCERRVRRGLCAGCGYDIRASHGRCPECGAVIAERNPATRSRSHDQ